MNLDTSSCHVSYNPISRVVSLRSPDGSWQSAAQGTAATLVTPRCSLDAAQMNSSASGVTVSASVPLLFNSTNFAGIHNVYLRAYDSAGFDSGWRVAGLWSVGLAIAPPRIKSLTPSSGSGTGTSFVVTITESAGTANLSRVELLIGPELDNTGCHAIYLVQLNTLYLRNTDGSWQPGTPGAAGTLANGRCTIDLGQLRTSAAEPDLSLTVPVQFSSGFAGNHKVFARAANRMNLDTSWRLAGTWTR
jgi:hypothetical protein